MQQPDTSPPPPPPPPASVLHVSDLAGRSAKFGSKWTATASPSIRDASDQPVQGALVRLHWSTAIASGDLACTTTAAGSCEAKLNLTSKIDGATFAVSSVEKSAVAYDSQANRVNSVTIARPR